MAISRWNPTQELATMQNVMDRIFYDTFRPAARNGRHETHSLALDVVENSDSYTITANVPGVPSEQIQIKLENEYLQITAEIPAQTVQSENARALLLERPAGHFSRTLHFPQQVDFDRADAVYDNGVLTLTLPKAPEAQPRTLTVRAGGSTNGSTNSNGNGNGSKNGNNR